MYSKLVSKVKKLEKEVTDLKFSLVKSKVFGKKISLKGMLKGEKITDLDLKNAKKSLFSGV